MSKAKSDSSKGISDIIKNPETNKKYLCGKFLGKGGFARCWELTDMETKQVYAGKVVSKSMLTKSNQKEKIAQEIEIHRDLDHKHIVKFYSFFEDEENVYILLELCQRRSLMEMQKRRRYLTDRETRYFIRQITRACIFLHEKHIIHRDLKLGNLFLNENMELKLGDFGLATRVQNNERKKTLCGTPNYIAPEVLSKKGHSYEVDVWSLGCIMYTLLVGRPPFETNSLKETYMLIKQNQYHVPSRVPIAAKNLIERMLHPQPKCRPSMQEILNDEYITSGPPIPYRLPTSCLSTCPRMDDSIWQAGSIVIVDQAVVSNTRKPLATLNEPNTNKPAVEDVKPVCLPTFDPNLDQNNDVQLAPADCYANQLRDMLTMFLRAKPADKAVINEEEALDPAAIPIFWISKWVDYTDKYGLGYQLCDNSVGVLFNDNTRIVQLTDGKNIQYIEQDGKEQYHMLEKYPDGLKKKVTLLQYFKNYMQEHLLKAGDLVAAREGDEFMRLPYLRAWFRTRSAIVMHLTNGTLQLNFFHDHTKIILCPLMGAVSYINDKKEFNTYRLKKLEKYGCSKDIYSRLRYASSMLDKLINDFKSS